RRLAPLRRSVTHGDDRFVTAGATSEGRSRLRRRGRIGWRGRGLALGRGGARLAPEERLGPALPVAFFDGDLEELRVRGGSELVHAVLVLVDVVRRRLPIALRTVSLVERVERGLERGRERSAEGADRVLLVELVDLGQHRIARPFA